MEKETFPKYIFLVEDNDTQHFFHTKEAALKFALSKGIERYSYLLNGSDFASKKEELVAQKEQLI
jgi:hypothetical protein